MDTILHLSRTMKHVTGTTSMIDQSDQSKFSKSQKCSVDLQKEEDMRQVVAMRTC